MPCGGGHLQTQAQPQVPAETFWAAPAHPCWEAGFSPQAQNLTCLGLSASRQGPADCQAQVPQNA